MPAITRPHSLNSRTPKSRILLFSASQAKPTRRWETAKKQWSFTAGPPTALRTAFRRPMHVHLRNESLRLPRLDRLDSRMATRALIELLRPANVVTAAADVLAGCAAAQLASGEAHVLPWLLASTCCLYGGGIVLNDFFDRNLDAVEPLAQTE